MWTVKSGLCSSGGRGLDAGIERRHDVEHHEQRRHEDTHRAFFGRQLDVEIRQPEQPDERGDRGRGADERRVADLHRLHADEKGVREDAAAENGGRETPDPGVAPREMRQVGGCRGGVEDERHQVHGIYRTDSGP